MNTTPPQRPPRPDEDLERFHNGDTLDNIPIIRVRKQFPWKLVVAAVGGSLLIAACLLVLVFHPGSRNSKATDLPRSSPTTVSTARVESSPSVTRRATAQETAPSSAPAVRSVAPTARPQSCVPVSYKLPDGPSLCESKADVCALGSPMYTPDIETICGAAPIARIYVQNTDLVEAGGCLSLESTAWVTGTTTYLGADAPGYQCNAYVDRTDLETGGVPLTACQEYYPNTRQTFLAELTTPAGTMTACITARHGA
ncbi:hypothetical protein ABZ567_06070 [Streptomyces sp. NPDC016459]|uniref:hypothetical protein n=1 Tax=Streptomyces sp. NPDC016459 TaxID=3157190 RepID=UPI0033DAA706